MSEQLVETSQEPTSQRVVGSAITYSACVQEAMRYNKLRSSEYPLVMSILSALLQGQTEEKWKEERQRQVETLTHQSPDQTTFHTEAANRYEQTVSCLKDLMLWPW
jgi:hypothetical protein